MNRQAREVDAGNVSMVDKRGFDDFIQKPPRKESLEISAKMNCTRLANVFCATLFHIAH